MPCQTATFMDSGNVFFIEQKRNQIKKLANKNRRKYVIGR